MTEVTPPRKTPMAEKTLDPKERACLRVVRAVQWLSNEDRRHVFNAADVLCFKRPEKTRHARLAGATRKPAANG